MKILAVDTAWDSMVVALSVDGKIYSETSLDGAKKHNSLILPMIDILLDKAGIKISEVDNFAAVVGPGSFTGIRMRLRRLRIIALIKNFILR